MATALTSVLPTVDAPPTASFASFEQLFEDDMSKIIMSSPSKSYALDPVPMWLLKELCDPISPAITRIVNLSLQTGHLPISMKKALVMPLLKKLILDKEIVKHYCPVSNLSFISEAIKTSGLKQLSSHMDVHNLHTLSQSA